MIEAGKTVELCTNALRLEQCLDWFEPSARMTFVVHLDGMREIHDYVCDYPGLWEIAVDAIKTARARGFRVTTNTLLILFAAFQIFAIGLLADLMVRLSRDRDEVPVATETQTGRS